MARKNKARTKKGGIEIRVSSIQTLEALRKLGNRVNDSVGLNERLAQFTMQVIAKSFAQEKAPYDIDSGKYWKPLSPDYYKEKTESGFPADILVRTGESRKSLYSLISHNGFKVEFLPPRGNLLTIHQFAGKGILPRRPVMPVKTTGELSKRFIKDLIKVGLAHLTDTEYPSYASEYGISEINRFFKK